MGAMKPEILGENSLDNEPDLPAKYCQYRDNGCDLAKSCLDCPFPKCMYEEPRGKQRWLKNTRDREIAALFSEEKKGIKELASIFAVSRRTIQRALKRSLLAAKQD